MQVLSAKNNNNRDKKQVQSFNKNLKFIKGLRLNFEVTPNNSGERNIENDYDKLNELVELRKKAKLHEKAEHLLGRSFRNCVIHS